MMNHKKTILYLASGYSDNPTTAAFIRNSSFINRLIHEGFRIIAITLSEHATVSQKDDSLIHITISFSGEIPSELKITDLPDWPDSNGYPGPDSTPAHYKVITRTAFHVIETYTPSLIIASAPPFINLPVGCYLSEKKNIPLLLEFRDAWVTGMYWPYPNRKRLQAAREWEKKAVLHATHIITLTETFRKILIDTYGQAIDSKSTTLRFGFDPETAATPSEEALLPELFSNKDMITIVHTGQFRGFDQFDMPPLQKTLQKVRHTLKRILIGASHCEKLRIDWMNPYYLMEAIHQLSNERPQIADSIRLIFAGQKFDKIEQWADEKGLEKSIIQLGPISPKQAQHLLHDATLLLLTLYGIEDCKYHWCIPSKLYSYMASGTPILALVPPGETYDILSETATSFFAQPDSPEDIKKILLNIYEAKQHNTIKSSLNQDTIKEYEHPLIQQQFIDIIQKIVK